MKISALLAPFPVSLSVPENLRQMSAALAQASPGDWVIFPEGAVSGYATDIHFLDSIDPGEVTTGLAALRDEAARCKINVWAGACVFSQGAWWNTAQGFLADGQVLVYQKINLANHERGVFSAGNALPVFEIDTPAGPVKVGVQICRELRYPEQWGWLARRGAQVILHLNNAINAEIYQPVWKSHLVSRAAETRRFVLSVNHAAPQQICPTLAIAPDGLVMAEWASAEARVLRVELDLSQVSGMVLDQCRSDVVAITPGPNERLGDHEPLPGAQDL